MFEKHLKISPDLLRKPEPVIDWPRSISTQFRRAHLRVASNGTSQITCSATIGLRISRGFQPKLRNQPNAVRANFIALRIGSSLIEATPSSYLAGFPFIEIASQWLPSLPPQPWDKRSCVRQNLSRQRFRFQCPWTPLLSTLKAHSQTHQLRFPLFPRENPALSQIKLRSASGRHFVWFAAEPVRTGLTLFNDKVWFYYQKLCPNIWVGYYCGRMDNYGAKRK